jgi:hypothetical protein
MSVGELTVAGSSSSSIFESGLETVDRGLNAVLVLVFNEGTVDTSLFVVAGSN